MDNEFANYDMFDRIIANEKKAKQWTTFWVVLFCLMGTAIIWMAFSIANIKKENIFLKAQQAAYDSSKIREMTTLNDAIAACAREKEALIDTFTLQLNRLNQSSGTQNTVSTIKANLIEIKTDVTKVKPRIFIQYNNADLNRDIQHLSEALKSSDTYYVAPAELLDMPFSTMIKVYKMDIGEEVNRVKEIMAKILRLDPKRITVRQIPDGKVKKPTIEVWVNGKRFTKADILKMEQATAN